MTPFPFDLRVIGDPTAITAEDDLVRLGAGARTDWFVDPGTGTVMANAPALVGAVDGDFMLAAHVEAAFASTFDAGALVVYRDETTWAKLAFEQSPQGRPMVVSVVTHGTSDDCNSADVDGAAVWLRVSRIGPALAFHASEDGHRWDLIRHFRFDAAQPEIGFEAQSPRGDGCVATFRQIAFERRTLGDLRDGL